MSESWRIGELVKATGLTVRALHHYDELGLVRPSERTGGGHRIYERGDVERLYRVLALRRLGLRLDDIARVIDTPQELDAVVRAHRDAVAHGLELHRRLLEDLDRLLEQPGSDLLQTIEVMQMIEEHYTPEQLETLAQRREQLGEQGMQRAQREWADLYAEARALKDAGVDPADPRVQALVERSEELIAAFTGGDSAMRESLDRVWESQSPERASHGMVDPELHAYLQKAREAR